MNCSDCHEAIDLDKTIHVCDARPSNFWREYTIRCRFTRLGSGPVDVFLAPDLDYAFALARSMWPTATTWECLGSKRVAP